MRKLLAPLFLLTAAVGCQHNQLRERTAQHAPTVTDLYYQQVLDNMARLNAEPDVLPHFSVAGTGTDNVQRTVTANYTLNWDLITAAGVYLGRYLVDKQSAGVIGSNAISEGWSTATTTDPDDLAMMKCGYMRALGCDDPECCKRLIAFLGGDSPYLAALQPGWYCIGRRCDVPKGACFVGRYKDVYVWVTPGGVRQLSLFTQFILDVAASESFSRPDEQAAKIKELEERAKRLDSLITTKTIDGSHKEFLNAELERTMKAMRYRTLLQERRHYKDLADQLRFCPATADEVSKAYYTRRAQKRVEEAYRAVDATNAGDVLDAAIRSIDMEIGTVGPLSPPSSTPLDRPKKNFYLPYYTLPQATPGG